MKAIRLSWVLSVTALCSSGLLAAEPEKPGLPVGQTAPLFALKDQNGKEIALESLLKKGPVAVVFHRSADWCLYCKLQIVQLQRNLKEIEASGGQIVGISYDSGETLKGFARRSKITFPLLADHGSRTIDAYGIRNPDVPERYQGVAYHATFILDQQGIIRSKLFQLSYQERPAVENLAQGAERGAGNKSGRLDNPDFTNVGTIRSNAGAIVPEQQTR